MVAPLGYYNLKFLVPFRYFNILLTTVKCDSLGHDWNLAQTHTHTHTHYA